MLTNLSMRERRFRMAPTLMVALVAGFAAQRAIAVITSDDANSLKKVKVVRQTSASYTSSTTWVDVPGAVATFPVPSYYEHLFVARFAGESSCSGTSGWCSVRILVNGLEMAPAAGTDYAFDSSDGGTETGSSWESHAVERSMALCGQFTTVTVKVQARTTSSALTLKLDDWHLTAEQFSTGAACPF